MRLYITLAICLLLTLNATVYSQSKRVNLSLRDVSLYELSEEIRKQTGYSFFVNEDKVKDLDHFSIDKTDASVKEVLDEVLLSTNMTYSMVDDVIVIKEEPKKRRSESIKVQGVVSDSETGELLPGVNIRVKNSRLGSITNLDGEFSILLPPMQNDIILTFSFIGYSVQEVPIGKGESIVNLDIKLTPEAKGLEEVVVTGYQEIDRREVTSAITTVTSDELDIVGAISVDRMLEGKTPGLMITNMSSTPGAAAKVRIRSGSTFTGNQSPLWVVDGVVYEDPVPLSAEDINSFDNVNVIGNALTGINPSDIAKIDILKDASATAIYGTRAANGVIVITTKRGEVGKPSLSYSGGFSFTQAPSYSDMNLMNSKDRIAVSRELYERNLGYDGTYENVDRLGYAGALMNLWDGTYNYEQFQDQVSYLETLNSDWFGELYSNSFSQRHAVSASGGSENTRYYFSLGYDDQTGTENNVGLNRITARSNVDLDLKDNLLLSLRMSGSVQEGTYNHSSINSFNTAYYTSRTVPIYDQNGEYFYQNQLINSSADDLYAGYNVLNEMDNSAKNVTNKDFTVAANLRWDILKNLRFTTQASYRNTTNLTEEWIGEDSYYIAKLRGYDEFEDLVNADLNNSTVPFGGIYSGGMVSQDTYTITNQLNFHKQYGKHAINVNLGQEARSINYWGATGFTSPGYNHYQGRGFVAIPTVSYYRGVDQSGLDFSTYDYDGMINWLTGNNGYDVYPTITDKTQNYMSAFGILNYVYDSRYVLNFNMRSDGSNAFGQYERYKFKPTWSSSFRWNIHNESFMQNAMLFDELALRGSYGVRGTMPNTSPYLIITDYGRNNAVYYPETTASLSSFPNANLRWEKTQTVNLGLNYSLLGGRVSGAFDYAYSKSDDLLQSRPISLVNGSATQMYNSGSKDVSSYEFMIRTVNVKRKDFAWSTHFNFSFDRDRVLEGFEGGSTLSVSNYLNGNIYRTGFPTNGFFSYQFDSLNTNGLPVFKHLVEEGMTAEEQLEKALVYEGSRVPLYYGGFGTQVRYKNFRVGANFTYKLGHKTRMLKLYNGNLSLPLPYENMTNEFLNRYDVNSDVNDTNIPALSDAEMRFVGNEASADGYDAVYVTNQSTVVPDGTNAWWMYDYSDARVVRADHIRLQTISLSYNVPTNLLKGTGIQSLNLGVQGSNLYVWAFDKRLKGQDPEQVSGIGLPSLPTYSFSINASF
ncbi:SusC/RagA family TonB-linked outer membrane protein [Limibacter armeniacum]|uniref:SusC/RagA family TonB-linked outer membrane protein n=1 Tax=Limibacter armeniacum TaxID=466084 RepID=UPI002FE69E03